MYDQPYIGEIRIFAGNFAPIYWAFCDGSLLPISENDTLFNLIGTTYGGDGQETFALPDLRGRVPIHMGTGPGLPTYVIGEAGGQETVTLTTQQIPSHNHVLNGGVSIPVRADSPGSVATAAGNKVAISPGDKLFSKTPAVSGNMAPFTTHPSTIGFTGGSQPHSNFQPYLVIHYIISLYGVYPQP